MSLFIDRLPLHCWTSQTSMPPQQHWTVVLPVLVTDRGLMAPPANLSLQGWVFDTAHRGEGLAWRHHLVVDGLDPDIKRWPRSISITTALGGKQTIPVRVADLWLVSNLPAAQPAYWRLHLDPGLPFHDVPTLPDPEFHRPLLGMRAMHRARLRVEIDMANDTVSVWTPDPPAPQP